jgi:uncharacterized membrane protein HdeD (DUF308 family)
MKHWILWLVAGLVSLLGGIMALANPLAASLTAELLAGWSRVGRFETPQPFAAQRMNW